MKRLLVVLFALTFAARVCAQQSGMINEPAGQCYQDLKSNLPEAIRWDDEQMMVKSRPLTMTTTGSVEVIARVFPEHEVDKKTKERVEMCRLVVAISAPVNSPGWNAMNSSTLFRNAALMKARIESPMKARKKKQRAT